MKPLQFPDAPEVPEPVRGGSFTVVFGALLGREGEGRALLRAVRDLGPAVDSLATVPPSTLGDMAMDTTDPLPLASATVLPSAGVDELVSVAGPGSGSPLAMVGLRQLGGGRRREGALRPKRPARGQPPHTARRVRGPRSRSGGAGYGREGDGSASQCGLWALTGPQVRSVERKMGGGPSGAPGQGDGRGRRPPLWAWPR